MNAHISWRIFRFCRTGKTYTEFMRVAISSRTYMKVSSPPGPMGVGELSFNGTENSLLPAPGDKNRGLPSLFIPGDSSNQHQPNCCSVVIKCSAWKHETVNTNLIGEDLKLKNFPIIQEGDPLKLFSHLRNYSFKILGKKKFTDCQLYSAWILGCVFSITSTESSMFTILLPQFSILPPNSHLPTTAVFWQNNFCDEVFLCHCL